MVSLLKNSKWFWLTATQHEPVCEKLKAESGDLGGSMFKKKKKKLVTPLLNCKSNILRGTSKS